MVQLSAAHRRALLVLTSIAALVIGAVLATVGDPGPNDTAPYGIVSLELAGDRPTADAILASWDRTAHLRAAFGVGLDYLYLLTYGAALALGCLAASDVLGNGESTWRRTLGRQGPRLARAVCVAVGLDAIENVALIAMLIGADGELWPLMSSVCAVPKFAIVGCALLYAGLGGAIAINGRLRG